MNETLLGKCGFYCGACPTYRQGSCAGCMAEHAPGDCFTRDCVLQKGLSFCGACDGFPCSELLNHPRATVLDKDWLRWKGQSRSNR